MTAPVIAEMYHRFTLEIPVRTPDGAGGAVETFEAAADIWGALRPLGGSESLEADGLKARARFEIWIRFRGDITPPMRFRLGARLFDIRAVADEAGRHRFLRCSVEERLT